MSRALAAVEAAAVIAVAAAAAVVAMAVVALYGDVTTSMSGVRLGATRSGGSGGSESAMAVGDEGMEDAEGCLLYTSPSPRDGLLSRMPSSA